MIFLRLFPRFCSSCHFFQRFEPSPASRKPTLSSLCFMGSVISRGEQSKSDSQARQASITRTIRKVFARVSRRRTQCRTGTAGSFTRKKKKDKAQQVTDRPFGSHRLEGGFESPFPFESTAGSCRGTRHGAGLRAGHRDAGAVSLWQADFARFPRLH